MSVYRRSVIALVVVVVAALLAGTAAAAPVLPDRALPAQGGAQTPEQLCASANTAAPENRQFDAAESVLAEGTDYWAIFCTAAGPVYVDLLENEAPITVNNFVFLAQQGYYNGTTFHRVLPGFMAQGGDPTGTGSGGPGYQFEDETANGLIFDAPGLLAMANAGPNTNGSQFFITYDLTEWLNGNHTIFGRVVSGMNHVELLTPRDPQQGPTFEGAALDTVLIVDDPASVEAAPDGPPDTAHFQALLEESVVTQMNPAFALDAEQSGVSDQAAALAAYAEVPDLQAALADLLTANSFNGLARVVLPLTECPADLSSLPIWLVAFEVDDFGAETAGEALVLEETRAAALVEAGVWDAQSLSAEAPVRLYERALADHPCGGTAVYHRAEFAQGRYVLAVDLVLDSTYINATTEPSPEQYLLYVAQDLLLGSLSGTLNRGNAALVTE